MKSIKTVIQTSFLDDYISSIEVFTKDHWILESTSRAKVLKTDCFWWSSYSDSLASLPCEEGKNWIRELSTTLKKLGFVKTQILRNSPIPKQQRRPEHLWLKPIEYCKRKYIHQLNSDFVVETKRVELLITGVNIAENEV